MSFDYSGVVPPQVDPETLRVPALALWLKRQPAWTYRRLPRLLVWLGIAGQGIGLAIEAIFIPGALLLAAGLLWLAAVRLVYLRERQNRIVADRAWGRWMSIRDSTEKAAGIERARRATGAPEHIRALANLETCLREQARFLQGLPEPVRQLLGIGPGYAHQVSLALRQVHTEEAKEVWHIIRLSTHRLGVRAETGQLLRDRFNRLVYLCEYGPVFERALAPFPWRDSARALNIELPSAG